MAPEYMQLLSGEDFPWSGLLLDIRPRGDLLARQLLMLSLQYLLGTALFWDLYLQQPWLSPWLRKERRLLLDIFLLKARLCAGMDRSNCLE